MSKNFFDQSYFDLFDVTPEIRVDVAGLRPTYLSLQQQCHPDRFLQKSVHERLLAQQNSMYLNDAYKTLSNPVTCAGYFLKQKGYTLPETTHDQTLLSELLEWQERVHKEGTDLLVLEQELKSALEESFAALAQESNVMYHYLRLLYLDKTLNALKTKRA